ncbi:hypothetical protein N9U04_02420 [Alphaproteobacteria bacterium]|nr:hypothetical protein [Alphaproteobacteria bacterium]
MKKYFFLLFFSMEFFYLTPLKAETVFYCQEEVVGGLLKENDSWRTGNFRPVRHTIKFNNDYSKLFGLDERRPFNCAPPYSHAPDTLACLSGYSNGESFIFSKTTKRFVFSHPIAHGGFDVNGGDTDTIAGGTCVKF